MPKTKEDTGTTKLKPLIPLNRTRARIMVPKPRVGKGGNPQKFACDIVTIHAGLNRPIDLEILELIKAGKHSKLLEEGPDGDAPPLQILESVTEIPEMSVAEVLQNCGDPPSVKWWLSIEKRPKVRTKLEKWLKKIADKQAKRREKAA